jgi:hypothetical protein
MTGRIRIEPAKLEKRRLSREHATVFSQELCIARLIWNDPLSNPDLSIVAWQLPSKCQLARLIASDHEVGAVSRGAEGAARRARSPGRRVHLVVLRRVGARAAETTDARGRFDDESR